MPVSPDDWRLRGQERYLKGAVLLWARWKCPRDEWDHDHCSFCWAKFMEEDFPEVLHFGYTTSDDYRWICKECFEDFKDQFEWSMESPL
jgi:hypothetical protein